MLEELSLDAVMTGVFIFASAMVFSPAVFTTLGWCVYGSLFLGSGVHVGNRLFQGTNAIISKFKERAEKNGLKPRSSAA